MNSAGQYVSSMIRKALYHIIIAMLVCVGCKQKEEDPAAMPKHVLHEALHMLESHDYDAYIAFSDIDCEYDSVYVTIMKNILRQHQESRESAKGNAESIDIVDAKIIADSICMVYYQFTYADSTKEVGVQKMVCVDGNWKIRIRN